MTRTFVYCLLALAVLLPAPGQAADLHIAAWNLEHLDDSEGEGCVGRSARDYADLARRVRDLGADIVAFQEVENAAAARRVFPASEWSVEMSRRPPLEPTRACWHRKGALLGHLATGFAIRKGIAYERHADLEAPGGSFQRRGTDITVRTAGGQGLRLLSVHLRTGCWGARQDRANSKRKTCATLRAQIAEIKAWIDRRLAESVPFVVLGDFNRRLALPGDWAWEALSPPSAPLLLLTQGKPFACGRYRAYIDHLVAGGGAQALLVGGSFRQWPHQGPHPDHCAVSAFFQAGR